MTSIVIRSGGQSGVDRAALDVAIARGTEYSGWCPRGGWAEDFPSPPGLLSKYPRLRETPSADPDQRTAWNVRDSDATLILVSSDDVTRSPGTNFAKRAAELIFQKPCLVADLSGLDFRAKVARWLAELVSTPGGSTELVLHVAGPRESESPGIYSDASELLDAILARPGA